MGSGSIEMLAPRERHRSGDSFQFTTMRSGLKNGLFKQNVLSVTQFTRQQVCLLQHVHCDILRVTFYVYIVAHCV